MPAFGFSAFLKLLSLSPQRQRSLMRSRLLPSRGSGYDFHRSFRRLAHRHLSEGEPIEALLHEADALPTPAECRSARSALEFLHEWRSQHPGRLVSFTPRTWRSPAGLFEVRFQPDFGIEIDGTDIAIHLWNTRTTDLDGRMTYAALSLFTDAYNDGPHGPADVGVLSVPDDRLYRLLDAPDAAVLSAAVVGNLDMLIESIRRELGSPPPGTEDRPRLGA